MSELVFEKKHLLRWMLVTVAVLTVLHVGQLGVYYWINNPAVFDFVDLLDFDVEGNLPTLYSSLALLIAAAFAGLNWKQSRFEQPSDSKYWLGLMVLLIYMGLDEGAAIHEKVGVYVASLSLFEAKGYFLFSWVVPYGLAALLIAVLYLRFVFSLRPTIRNGLMISGVLFLLGAFGIEMLSANVASQLGLAALNYSILYTIEELCEMLSIILLISTLFTQLSSSGVIRLRFN